MSRAEVYPRLMEIHRQQDPLLLSCAQAAELCGVSYSTFRKWLNTDPEFYSAVMIEWGGWSRPRVSRPKLERYIAGPDAPVQPGNIQIAVIVGTGERIDPDAIARVVGRSVAELGPGQ